MTGEVVESRSMVYVVEGDIVLVSRAALETLGCIQKTFPRVGEFLEDGDLALTGRAFAINPFPSGIRSDGTIYDEILVNKFKQDSIINKVKEVEKVEPSKCATCQPRHCSNCHKEAVEEVEKNAMRDTKKDKEVLCSDQQQKTIITPGNGLSVV